MARNVSPVPTKDPNATPLEQHAAFLQQKATQAQTTTSDAPPGVLAPDPQSPTPEFDVYARDGLMSTDPRARRTQPPDHPMAVWLDGKVRGRAQGIGQPGEPVPQFRVVADSRFVAAGGMMTMLRAGKVVSEATHDIESLKRQHIRLEPV
jgi:hypothetical protein